MFFLCHLFLFFVVVTGALSADAALFHREPIEKDILKDFATLKREMVRQLTQDDFKGLVFSEKTINKETENAYFFESSSPYAYPEFDQQFHTKKGLKTYLDEEIQTNDLWERYTYHFIQNYDIAAYDRILTYSGLLMSHLFYQFYLHVTTEKERMVRIKKNIKKSWLLPPRQDPHALTKVDKLHKIEGLSGKNKAAIIWDCGFLEHKDLGTQQSLMVINRKSVTPSSDDIHGTHVSGIVSAQKNQIGVAPKATLYAVEYTNLRDFNQTTQDVDAVAINMSFSTIARVEDLKEFTRFSQILKEKDRLLVFAAGNDAIFLKKNRQKKFQKFWQKGIRIGEDLGALCLTDTHLADRIIIVGSLKRDGVTVSEYSNLPGDLSEHFVYAPGEDIYSTVDHHKYRHLSGTSMAAPHVTGILLLLAEAFPNLTAVQLKKCLLYGCDPFWAEPGNKFSKIYDPAVHGSGRVNAANAFLLAKALSSELS